MKIILELPNWIKKRNIYILAGIEEVARKLTGQSWEIKKNRCSKCGECCQNVPPEWPHGEKDGNCKHLRYEGNEYLCGLGANRPFKCCVGDGDESYCNIRWEKVK